MKQSTVELLIEQGILILEEPDCDTMSTDGYTSYVINDDYMIMTKSQVSDKLDVVDYVQLVAQDPEEQSCWVLQMASDRENPTFYEQNSVQEFELYKKL